MSPRPRKVSDDDVFAAVYRVMARRVPAELTLAEIAAEAGVTAGALVQRFGSKRDLLRQVAERSSEGATAWLDELRSGAPSPLSVLFTYADCLAAMGDSEAGFAHHLAWLQLDLTDADFRNPLKRQMVQTRAVLQAVIADAMACGELQEDTDAAELARAVEVTLNGSLLTWAFHAEGRAAPWLRHDLEVLLRAYRA